MGDETGVAVIGGSIELCKMMKLENMAASGGEAKQMISEGLVRVNGKIETRKRRKMLAGDVVECNGRKVKVFMQDGTIPAPDEASCP